MYQISNEKFGLFVTELRKKKNLTQKDLAEKLYVSDKTVSKEYFCNLVGDGSSKCVTKLEKGIDCYAFYRSFYGGCQLYRDVGAGI